MRLVLRGLAVAIAVAAFIDPAFARRSPGPLAIEFAFPPPSAPDHAEAVEAGRRLRSELPQHVRVGSGAAPAAVVAMGHAELRANVSAPVFALRIADETPGFRILSVESPEVMSLGERAQLGVTVQVTRLRGKPVTVGLETKGAIIATETAAPAKDSESVKVAFDLALPSPGLHKLRIVARAEGVPHAIADTAVVVQERRLRVLVFEPRPSWPATFVRRDLEADPLFDVVSVTHTSQQVVASSDAGGEGLARRNLDSFDALVIGAPDALRETDITAIVRYVSGRGGHVWLLPDRSIPDAVRRRLDLPAFDEVLLEKPVGLQSGAVPIRASELLLPRTTAGLRTIASVDRGGARRPVLFELPRGRGSIFVSGALDAWRFRASSTAVPSSWRTFVADAAALSAAPLSVAVSTRIVRPGADVTVTATIRPDRIDVANSTRMVPPISASVTSAHGAREFVRLWPSSAVGQFTGRFKAGAEGEALVGVTARDGSVDTPFVVDSNAATTYEDRSAELELTARATGGEVVTNSAQLREHLGRVEPVVQETMARPMRSPWWILPFATLLCAEWSLRRRNGLR